MEETPEKVYIASKMSGLPGNGVVTFRTVAKNLRDAGYEVVSPVELDEGEGIDPTTSFDRKQWARSLRRDIAAIMDCDGVVVFGEWRDSEGARAEVSAAHSVDIPIYQLSWDEDSRPVLNPISSLYLSQHLLNEERIVNESTGGAKGRKLARFDLLPPYPLTEVAKVYGYGARKYEDRNWEKGYDWSLSFGALQRHAWQFWGGESWDEDGFHHLAAVCFHAMALMHFEQEHPDLDSR